MSSAAVAATASGALIVFPTFAEVISPLFKTVATIIALVPPHAAVMVAVAVADSLRLLCILLLLLL